MRPGRDRRGRQPDRRDPTETRRRRGSRSSPTSTSSGSRSRTSATTGCSRCTRWLRLDRRSRTASASRSEQRRGTVPGVVVAPCPTTPRRSSGASSTWTSAPEPQRKLATLVAPGDPIVLSAPPVELAAGRVASRSLDNRAGVYVALEAFRRLEGRGIAVVAPTHEELGGQGAQVAARVVRPEVALALDVTYATDAPGGDVHESGAHRLGGGPAIFRGPTVHPAGVRAPRRGGTRGGDRLHRSRRARRLRRTPTSVFASGEGIPTGVVSVPLRNMHSPIEIVELADLEACVRARRRVRPAARAGRELRSLG